MKITREFLKEVLEQKATISKLKKHLKTISFNEEDFDDCKWAIETGEWYLKVSWFNWRTENNVDYNEAEAVRELVDSCCKLQKDKITPENTLLLEKILMLVGAEVA